MLNSWWGHIVSGDCNNFDSTLYEFQWMGRNGQERTPLVSMKKEFFFFLLRPGTRRNEETGELVENTKGYAGKNRITREGRAVDIL